MELLQKVVELVLIHSEEASVVVQVSLALRSMVLGQVEVGRFGRAGEGVRGESRSCWTDLDRVRRSRLKETSDTHIMTDSGQLSTTLQQFIWWDEVFSPITFNIFIGIYQKFLEEILLFSFFSYNSYL